MYCLTSHILKKVSRWLLKIQEVYCHQMNLSPFWKNHLRPLNFTPPPLFLIIFCVFAFIFKPLMQLIDIFMIPGFLTFGR